MIAPVYSSGDGHHWRRTPSPGCWFGVVDVIDTADNAEAYSSIAQTYERHTIVWCDFKVLPGDWIEAHAHGQVDQEGTNIMEITQRLELLTETGWWELSEEVGVNINARTTHNVSEHLDRHHEDFMAYGFFDVGRLKLTGPKSVLVGWNFKARESTVSAPIPKDSCKLVVKVWREFGPWPSSP